DLGVVKRILVMDIVRNRDQSELFSSQHGYLNGLGCYMLKSVALLWIITQSYRLCNILNDQGREEEDGEYFLCKWGWKYHV
ncbi:hypothetical protein A2U01_0043372, partial [Trifolium medium]|nr:hypothetical protein [Trifolium medium]